MARGQRYIVKRLLNRDKSALVTLWAKLWISISGIWKSSTKYQYRKMGGLGNSGNARKKTFFFIEAFPYDGDVNKVEEKKDVLGDNDDDDDDFDNKLVSTRMLHIEPVGHESRDAGG